MNIHKSIELIPSVDGIHSIRCCFYEPEEPARAVLQITHGMCEYLERYEAFARYLCGRGFAVCGSDHLGHGELAQAAGELGYFAPKDGWKLLPQDVHRLTLRMKEHHPALPYFLMGHSMGSFVARCYLELYGKELDGAIIMGTSGGNPFAGLGIRLAEREIRRHGAFYRSPMLNRLSMGSNNQRFRAEGDQDSWLTRDQQIRRAYREDPLCSFVFTSAGFRDLFSLLKQVSRPEWARNVPADLPILLVSGAEDPIGDYGRGVKKVFRRLKEAGVEKTTLRLYEGGRHEILNELNRDKVFRELGDYLEGLLKDSRL